MPTPIDSLKRGDYIVVTGCKQREVNGEFTGTPTRIMEICLPFIAVTDDHRTWSVDVRFWEFQKVTKRYYDVMSDGDNGPSEEVESEDSSGWNECPQCRKRLIQKMIQHTWHYYCSDCRLIVGAVP